MSFVIFLASFILLVLLPFQQCVRLEPSDEEMSSEFDPSNSTNKPDNNKSSRTNSDDDGCDCDKFKGSNPKFSAKMKTDECYRICLRRGMQSTEMNSQSTSDSKQTKGSTNISIGHELNDNSSMEFVQALVTAISKAKNVNINFNLPIRFNFLALLEKVQVLLLVPGEDNRFRSNQRHSGRFNYERSSSLISPFKLLGMDLSPKKSEPFQSESPSRRLFHRSRIHQ